MKRALLLDLDETLMVEEPAAEVAFLASAQLAVEHGADPQALATDARARARELWYAAPTHLHAMALVTNGAACLQREKLAASGLGERFEAVIVSADVGVAKPDSAIFEHALSELGARRDRAVMVGDSIAKDVDGALAVGLDAVWVNRSGRSAPPDRPDLVEISTLDDLPDVLGSLG
ncbi:MAG TPA: HAD-IA family hydrolase [Solirubrobacteraceae bacterium]|nr:HAD-IA family hydrolase [Solirubrobacteraceae bacterium]